MLRGLYESAAGMMARQTLQDITANNLANVNSAGFQREIAALRAERIPTADADKQANPRRSPERILAFAACDTHGGVLQPTGAPGDVALNGPGYFTVQTERGVRLLRSGSLAPNARGELALPSGEPVLDRSGRPIPVGADRFAIGADGTVAAPDGHTIGQLRVVKPVGDLRPEGGSLLAADALAEIAPGTVPVLSGQIERSNVEPVREMVDMIAGMRAYEAGQKAIQAQDQTLQQLLSLLQG